MKRRRLRNLLLLLGCVPCHGNVEAFNFIHRTRVQTSDRSVLTNHRSSTRFLPAKSFATNLYTQRISDNAPEEDMYETGPKKKNRFVRYGKSLSERAFTSVSKLRGRGRNKSTDIQPSITFDEPLVDGSYRDGDSDLIEEDEEPNSIRQNFMNDNVLFKKGGQVSYLESLSDPLRYNMKEGEEAANACDSEEDEKEGILIGNEIGNFASSLVSHTSSRIDDVKGLMKIPSIDVGESGSKLSLNITDSLGRLPMTNELAQIKDTIVERATSSTKEIGNLYQYLDRKAKSSLTEMTGELGEISVRIDSQIKEKVNSFTGEDEYKVGDITKTIIKKVATEEYNFADIILLCKILIKLGADFSPVATILPIRLLLELFDYSIALELSDKFVKTISVELGKRLNSPSKDNDDDDDDEYVAGEMTRQAILEYTGKNDYSFGDISKKIVESNEDRTQQEEVIVDDVKSTAPVGYSLGTPWKENEREVPDNGVDVLAELEECLAMEKALIEKLQRLQSKQ